MDKKKVKRIFLLFALIIVIVLVCLVVPYIVSGQLNANGGDEIGEYYNQDNVTEKLTVHQNMEFSIELENLVTSGTYKTISCCWQDYYVILMMDNGESITASYSQDKIIMTYSNRTIYFIK